ncbi:MAG: HD domain-containing phosphohydrolase [Spirochaetota bacterium]
MNDNRQSVLIVDDVPENISILNEILHKEYNIKAATSGKGALKIAMSNHQPDIIILDIMMPEMDGYEVCRRLKSDNRTKNIPVMFITALNDTVDEQKGLELGAVDYIKKPVSPPIVKQRIRTQLDLLNQNVRLESMVRERTRELEETRLAIIQRLGRAAEFKDNETGMHVIRISNFSRIIAMASGVSENEANLLLHAAPMHDIGKIGIPDSILLKPGKLDAGEWEIMKKHPVIGADIIGEHSSEIMHVAKICAMYHHERYDGSGYPAGLAGDDIPYYARIVAIVDVYDALTSERPYKKAWPLDEALDLIKRERGSHFDPDLADSFLNSIDDILEVQKSYPEQPCTNFICP